MRIAAIRPLADTAVTVELSTEVGTEASAKVTAAYQAIQQAIELGLLAGVSEVAAAFCSVTVHYDCLVIRHSDLIKRLTSILDPLTPTQRPRGRSWLLPCCYDAEMGLDLGSLADTLGRDSDDIIAIHLQTTFYVYALGFLPGLPFLGDLPANLARPRRSEPRTRVPAGSVAIANRMCVIYPWNSPGGWHIVGRCPVPLFDISLERPALIAAGDTVQFRSISPEEFHEMRAADCDRAALLVSH